MTFAVIIIIAVYLPILFLQGLEGRMFRPMAITVCAAFAGSLLLALTMVPMLASFSFPRGIPRRRATSSEHAQDERGWISEVSRRLRRTAELGHPLPRGDPRLALVAGDCARVTVLHRHRIHAPPR